MKIHIVRGTLVDSKNEITIVEQGEAKDSLYVLDEVCTLDDGRKWIVESIEDYKG